MFEIPEYIFGVTIFGKPCTQHAGCTAYSVIPNDPNQDGYWLHSAGPNFRTGGDVTMEILRARLESTKGYKRLGGSLRGI